MNLIEQISIVRRFLPDFLQHIRDLLGYEHQDGFNEAAELWLLVYDDNDEVVGLERISDYSEGIS